MACRPPVWLWKNYDKWDTNPEAEWKQEFQPDPPAADTLAWEIKSAFDEAAGSEFVYKAYATQWLFARQLAWFALGSINEIGLRRNCAEGVDVPEEAKQLLRPKKKWYKSLRNTYGPQ
ncbi:hypothetical protein GE09DRAFT_1052943 [Coniochaeta sp. 2T2.1]|nr:hypothetical protein GE09DRAFT_1052943 [Coniochaeta sp. 2T2.1]